MGLAVDQVEHRSGECGRDQGHDNDCCVGGRADDSERQAHGGDNDLQGAACIERGAESEGVSSIETADSAPAIGSDELGCGGRKCDDNRPRGDTSASALRSTRIPATAKNSGAKIPLVTASSAANPPL